MRRAFVRMATASSLVVSGTAARAQPESDPPPEESESESAPDWALNATLEGYYEYNVNEPYDRVNRLRAYDTRSNSFGIQQLGFVFETAPAVEEGRRFGLRTDLQSSTSSPSTIAGCARVTLSTNARPSSTC